MTTRAGGYIAGLVGALNSSTETYRKSAESGNLLAGISERFASAVDNGNGGNKSTTSYKNQGYDTTSGTNKTWVSAIPGASPPPGLTLTLVHYYPLTN